MKKMGVFADTTVSEAVEMFPQIFPLFRQIGMCCVNEENVNMTVEDLCIRYGVDPDSFLEAVQSVIA